MNTAPPPGRSAASIRPPWASTIRLQIESPRPRPVSFVLTNGSKIRLPRSAGQPAARCRRPRIVSHRPVVPASERADAPRAIVGLDRGTDPDRPPSGVASRAFRSRFRSTWRTWPASASMTIGPSGSSRIDRDGRAAPRGPRPGRGSLRGPRPGRTAASPAPGAGRNPGTPGSSPPGGRSPPRAPPGRGRAGRPRRRAPTADWTRIFIEVSGLRSSCASPAASWPRAASCSARSASRWLRSSRSTTVPTSSAIRRSMPSRLSTSQSGERVIGPTTSLSLPAASRIGHAELDDRAADPAGDPEAGEQPGRGAADAQQQQDQGDPSGIAWFCSLSIATSCSLESRYRWAGSRIPAGQHVGDERIHRPASRLSGSARRRSSAILSQKRSCAARIRGEQGPLGIGRGEPLGLGQPSLGLRASGRRSRRGGSGSRSAGIRRRWASIWRNAITSSSAARSLETSRLSRSVTSLWSRCTYQADAAPRASRRRLTATTGRDHPEQELPRDPRRVSLTPASLIHPQPPPIPEADGTARTIRRHYRGPLPAFGTRGTAALDGRPPAPVHARSKDVRGRPPGSSGPMPAVAPTTPGARRNTRS